MERDGEYRLQKDNAHGLAYPHLYPFLCQTTLSIQVVWRLALCIQARRASEFGRPKFGGHLSLGYSRALILISFQNICRHFLPFVEDWSFVPYRMRTEDCAVG